MMQFSRNSFQSLLLAIFSSTSILANANLITEDWTAGMKSYDVHAIAPDRFRIEESDRIPNQKIARFTTYPGDKLNHSTGERSEVVLGGWRDTSRWRVLGSEGTEFYRVSVKLLPGWTAPERNSVGQAWGMFIQLHGPNEYSAPPAIAIWADTKFSLFVLGGNINFKKGGLRFMTNPNLNIGKWVDFIMKITWATDDTGAVSVFRRDEGSVTWESVSDIKGVATLQHKGALIPNSHYWKAGIYRSESSTTSSLLMAPILRGSSFEEVSGN